MPLQRKLVAALAGEGVERHREVAGLRAPLSRLLLLCAPVGQLCPCEDIRHFTMKLRCSHRSSVWIRMWAGRQF